MEYFWYGFVFVLGTLIGSFLNVFIYRLHTGRSLNGRSHCMSCGETLTWYELFPIVSYLVLRARCRYCGAYIPARYLTTELLTGLTFLFVYYLFGHSPVLTGFYMVLFGLLIVITIYDIRHTIIPNELTISVLVLATLYVLFLSGDGLLWNQIFSSVVGGIGAGTFFFGLWYASRGKWLGLGDAKLAVPLGMIAGPIASVSMVVLSFWTGAFISVLLLILKQVLEAGKTTLRFRVPRLTIQSEVPFAPFLILGFLLVHFLHADIFVLTSQVLSFAFGM